MEIIKYPDRDQWYSLLKRPVQDIGRIEQAVRPIIEDVRANGDEALRNYTRKFDKAAITDFKVSDSEFDAAEKKVAGDLKAAIDMAVTNITSFHQAQKGQEIKVETAPGVVCWQRPVPVSSVGLYIPGGTAPLFSTILMLAIPASIAGCNEIILCSPPDQYGMINDVMLYAAKRVGVRNFFKVGGTQAIAAMAYGTESIPKVSKIVGPGNQYVTAAKQLVARDTTAIDMPAGPSEVMVLADNSANPVFIASDLLSQAEHMADSQVMLVSADEKIIEQAIEEIDKQVVNLPKCEYARQSLAHSKAFLVKNKKEMMDLCNMYAPEHLIISTSDADELANHVINAGSVFLGNYTPESAGDYISGTNHVLPTNGWAASYSGVNLDCFYKKITFQKISKKGLEEIGPAIEKMATAEELIAHRRAVSLRIRNST